MNLDEIPLFSMLKSRLGYLGERQKVIATNIANSDTPGYAPRDLKPFSSDLASVIAGSGGGLSLARPAGAAAARGQTMTAPGHMAPRRSVGALKPKMAADSEITLDGNGVVLEEQTMKLTEARMDYDAAIGFYQKSLGLLRMAARAPGK
jgi:flagellar basal-body rod protein FlgB